MIRKILTWLAVILIAIWVIHHPEHTSHIVHQVFAAVGRLGDSF